MKWKISSAMIIIMAAFIIVVMFILMYTQYNVYLPIESCTSCFKDIKIIESDSKDHELRFGMREGKYEAKLWWNGTHFDFQGDATYAAERLIDIMNSGSNEICKKILVNDTNEPEGEG